VALLPGYDQYVDITIPDTQIDSDLTHFPILVKGSTSCGIGGKDVSFIFDELGSNSLKIAFTEAGLTDQKYAEIEDWDAVSEEFSIWASKSDLVLDADGGPAYALRMYFDNDHADNTDYIGVSGSAGRNGPRENVWDANHVMVQHMADETTSTITGSTSNDKDGTKEGANKPAEATAQIGLGQHFEDTTSDNISFGDDSDFELQTYLIEGWLKRDVIDDEHMLVSMQYQAAATEGLCGVSFWIGSDNKLKIANAIANSFENFISDGTYENTGVYYYLAATKTGTTVKMYVNGAEVDSDTLSNATIDYTTGETKRTAIGARWHAGSGWKGLCDGLEDEIRVSDSIRSVAWIKANYNFGIDNVLSWGDKVTVFVPQIVII